MLIETLEFIDKTASDGPQFAVVLSGKKWKIKNIDIIQFEFKLLLKLLIIYNYFGLATY